MTDIEQAFNEICDQLGCAYDNEAALFAIDKLQKSAQSDAEPTVIKTTGYNMEGDGGPCMGLAQSDAEPVAWQPDADMRAELDRSELVARALLKEIIKQIDCIEAEGNIEWHRRIKLSGELYLPDLAVAVLAVLYTATPHPDASAGLIEAAEWHEAAEKRLRKEADILYTESRFSEAGTFQIQATNHRNSAKHFRARAAERSGEP